jgi:starvation-inducible DNA-binding protein
MQDRVMSKKPESPTATNGQHGHPRERQPYRTIVSVPIALDTEIRRTSVENLNQLLAEVSGQLGRLLHAHEIILTESRAMARQAAEGGDDGTNDLLVSQVIRTNEQQVWFVGEHLADGPRSPREE